MTAERGKTSRAIEDLREFKDKFKVSETTRPTPRGILYYILALFFVTLH